LPGFVPRVGGWGGDEARPACVHGDSLCGRRKQLHEPDRPGLRPRVGLELRLLVDDRREQRGIEVVVVRMASDDLLVVERIPDAFPPRRLRRLERDERDPDPPGEDDCGDDAPHPVNRAMTSATNASSPSSVPSLTYEKSARATFSASGMSRRSRSSVATSERSARSSAGAVTTTTTSKRASPPVS